MLGSFWRYIKHSIREYSRDNCTQLAAAISYYVLFSIVPLTFLLVSVFGLVIRSERLRADVEQRAVDTIGLERGNATIELDNSRLQREGFDAVTIARLKTAIASMSDAQRQALVDELKANGHATVAGVTLQSKDVIAGYDNTITDTLKSVAGASAQLTVVSLVLSAWSASAMFGAVRRAINIIWGVEYQKPYLQQKLKDLGMVFAFGLLLLASVVGTGLLRTFREVSDNALGPLSTGTGPFWGAVPYVLPAILSFAVFTALYRFVPAVPVRFREVWFGALIAAVLFEVLKNGFAFYVTHFNAYDLLYGSLGGILLFLTAVYFASAILLMGAEFSAAMPGLEAGAFRQVRDPNKPKVGLVHEVTREVGKFLRGLVLPPRDQSKESESSRTGHDQLRP
jgi:YihY family inner membrane protein